METRKQENKMIREKGRKWKVEKGFEHLDFGNLDLFRISDLEFRICNLLLVILASGTLGESGERKVDSGKVERWKS